jgi:RNA polymerase sigma factor (sigma-70 family)
MRATGTGETSLVVAAQAGDRRALDELVKAYLPLVYTIVRRALSGHPDVDDVVQDTMLRAVRELGGLRTPESFRAWLAAIALRQIGTHRHRLRGDAERTTDLDEVAEEQDADADFEDLTILRLELSRQRRQVMRASRWLDPEDRGLLSLWWLETAGRLTRTELAAAMGVPVAHAGVRVQRMRTQLDLSRSLLAALDAKPRCAGLGAVVAGWDGLPSPLWRKRISRHTRSCPVCVRAADGMMATERLLIGSALLPVPVGLTAALAGNGGLAGTALGAASVAALSNATGFGAVGAGVKAGLIGQLAQAVAAHPVAAAVAAAALAGGTAVTTTNWPTPAPPAVIAAPSQAPTTTSPATVPPGPTAASRSSAPGPASAAPSPSAGSEPLGLGPASLESVNQAGLFVAVVGDLGVLAPAGAKSGQPARQRATFEVVPGLADAGCFSFRAQDGRYLRHSLWRLRLSQDEGTKLFRGDATFCTRTGTAAGSVSLESSNYPGGFLRHRGNELWVDFSDGTEAFLADRSFRIRPPLAG